MSDGQWRNTPVRVWTEEEGEENGENMRLTGWSDALAADYAEKYFSRLAETPKDCRVHIEFEDGSSIVFDVEPEFTVVYHARQMRTVGAPDPAAEPRPRPGEPHP